MCGKIVVMEGCEKEKKKKVLVVWTEEIKK